MHIDNIIHRSWDSKLVNLIADYWRKLSWENEEGKTEAGDKFHISFYEIVIDAEITYGISIPPLKKNGHPEWETQDFHSGEASSSLKARTKLVVAVSVFLHEKNGGNMWRGK